MIEKDKIIILETEQELKEMIVNSMLKPEMGFVAEKDEKLMRKGVVGYIKGVPVVFSPSQEFYQDNQKGADDGTDPPSGCGGCGGCS